MSSEDGPGGKKKPDIKKKRQRKDRDDSSGSEQSEGWKVPRLKMISKDRPLDPSKGIYKRIDRKAKSDAKVGSSTQAFAFESAIAEGTADLFTYRLSVPEEDVRQIQIDEEQNSPDSFSEDCGISQEPRHETAEKQEPLNEPTMSRWDKLKARINPSFRRRRSINSPRQPPELRQDYGSGVNRPTCGGLTIVRKTPMPMFIDFGNPQNTIKGLKPLSVEPPFEAEIEQFFPVPSMKREEPSQVSPLIQPPRLQIPKPPTSIPPLRQLPVPPPLLYIPPAKVEDPEPDTNAEWNFLFATSNVRRCILNGQVIDGPRVQIVQGRETSKRFIVLRDISTKALIYQGLIGNIPSAVNFDKGSVQAAVTVRTFPMCSKAYSDQHILQVLIVTIQFVSREELELFLKEFSTATQ